MDIILLSIAGLAAIVLIYAIAQFNGLVQLRNHIAESWSNVDTELKRRYELIPNLVESVKGYASHEREALANAIGSPSRFP
jgi:LemA protein